MRRHAQTPARPSDGGAPVGPARRAVARLFGQGGDRRRPHSIETDAKVHAAHVRPASFRAEML